jgi:CBS domain-containing protein
MATSVDQIMDTSPVTVRSDTDVGTVVHTLHEHELPGVPVVDENNLCVGIITENDLVIPDEEGELHLPHYLSVFGGLFFLESMKGFEKRLRKAFASTAADLMTPSPLTVTPETTAQQAARLIVDTHHNRLPVVDDQGRLVGVVTRVDVLEAIVE